jgi:hypothetical protein
MEKEKATNKMVNRYALISIALVSCSMLMYEILLTRICALRFEFHFGFLIVSNCLLGIGAAGSMVFLLQSRIIKNVRLWIWIFSTAYMVSLLMTYPFLIRYDVNFMINFLSLASIVKFSIFNIVATVPFFFAGGVIGLILTFNAEQVNKVYFFDLIGAGLGCLFCPFFLWKTGGGGCFIFLTLLSLAAIMVTALPTFKRIIIPTGIVLGIIGLIILPKLDHWFPVPSKSALGVAQGYWINILENSFYSRWSATSRVDLIHIPQGKEVILGVNGEKVNIPVPEEKFILQDGSAGTFILNFSENHDQLKNIGTITLQRSLSP